jgi:hypothetical protein
MPKICAHEIEHIGAYFGVGESGVCQAALRVTERMKMDRRLTKRIDAMEKRF